MNEKLIEEIAGKWAEDIVKAASPKFMLTLALREYAQRNAATQASEPNAATPAAWRIELPDSQYFVDDIDDAQAVDDLTNSNAVAIPLYQYPDNSTHEELRLIHGILLCVGECPPVYDYDTLTVRYVKDLCHAFNAQNQGPSPTSLVPDTPTPSDPRTDHGAALLMIADLQRELAAAYKKYNDALIHAANAEQVLSGELAAAKAKLKKWPCTAIEQGEVGNPCGFLQEVTERAEKAEVELAAAKHDLRTSCVEGMEMMARAVEAEAALAALRKQLADAGGELPPEPTYFHAELASVMKYDYDDLRSKSTAQIAALTAKLAEFEPSGWWWRYEGNYQNKFEKGWIQSEKPDENGIELYARKGDSHESLT